MDAIATTADQLTTGQTFTDNMGHTHTVTGTLQGQASGQGVYIYVEGQGYPEFYLNDVQVFVYPAEAPAAAEVAPEAPAAADRPYYVLTRYAARNGELRKGRRSFRTRAEQTRYIRNAPMSVAITAYN